jgi:hypothetical protein
VLKITSSQFGSMAGEGESSNSKMQNKGLTQGSRGRPRGGS